MTELSGWQNFYVIVGSSAGALIGLQFVVITLIADAPIHDGAEQAGHAFATPTIVHFGAVLLLAALVSAPWSRMAPAAVLLELMGASGVLYTAVVARRMVRQTAYRPQGEDWLFHLLLPLAAYVTLATCALMARSHPAGAMYGVGAAAVLLLFIGIHNAWDAVTYHVFNRRREHSRWERRN